MWMWRWFVVPTFNTAPIHFTAAVGLCEISDLLLMGLSSGIAWHASKDKLRSKYPEVDDDWVVVLKQLILIFLLYPLAFGTAFVVSLCMP